MKVKHFYMSRVSVFSIKLISALPVRISPWTNTPQAHVCMRVVKFLGFANKFQAVNNFKWSLEMSRKDAKNKH